MTAMSCILVVFASAAWYFLSSYNIYRGISVAGINLGGKSRSEAVQLLSLLEKKHRDKKITLYYNEIIVTVDGVSIDYHIDVDGTTEEAWNYGHNGLWWDRIQKIRNAAQYGYESPLKINYDERKLANLIEQWETLIARPPRNATMSIGHGKMIPEEQGRRLSSDDLRSLILDAFMKKENEEALVLPVIVLDPVVTVDVIESAGIREPLSVYSTLFNKQDANRSTNIKVAACKVNGYILYPDQVFSFNDIVGPREKVYGFKEALEIMDGELISGVGGGICQLSSTLYNVALLANLEIIERHNHSKSLSYIPLGRDATVVFGSLDFKFANNTSNPIMVIAEVQDNKLSVGIFGQHSLAEVVEIISVNQEAIPPATIKKDDTSLYLGEVQIVKEGKPGCSITTLRVVRLGNQEIKREILSKDFYLPDHTVMKVGTQIPPFLRKIQ